MANQTHFASAGTQPFHPLPQSLLVRPPTLIPRPETEHWLAHLAHILKGSLNHTPGDQPFTILDIGTGTGCIPLVLAHSLRHSSNPVHAIGVDQSTAAARLARENVARCGTDVPGRIHVLQGDLFTPDFVGRMKQAGRASRSEGDKFQGFNLVVSNPPYIPRRDYEGLAASVKEWEDRRALVGEVHPSPDLGADALVKATTTPASPQQSNEQDDDGLIFYRKITSLLDQLLSAEAGVLDAGGSPAPVVAFEVGQGQAGDVQALLRARGYRAEAVDDQWGIQRLVLGYRA